MNSTEFGKSNTDFFTFKLTEDILRLADLLAQNAHDAWAKERLAQGWKYGVKRNDETREHPCLVSYADLPEEERQFNRDAAIETIKSLMAMGYRKEYGMGDTSFHVENSRKIVATLRKTKLTLAELRKLWEERQTSLWSQDVETYRRAVDSALKLGEAFLAFDMAVEGMAAFRGDLRLLQLQALALARTGATRRANEILHQLRVSGHRDEETLGILARTHKDFWQIVPNVHEKKEHLKLSYELYLESFKRNRGYYSGINAAATALLSGDPSTARKLAQEVVDLCRDGLAQIPGESEERYWLEATQAEAVLILGRLEDAAACYTKAAQVSKQNWVVVNRTRAQARLLLEASGLSSKTLDTCFMLPKIVVCAGHMFDRPNRKHPRFPCHMEERIRDEMRLRLADMEAQIGFASAACGADMLFAETILERGGEINVVLPFRREEFKESSVDIIPGLEMSKRFLGILDNAATVNTLNEWGASNDVAAYEYCNLTLIGLALLRGQFLGLDVRPLAVWDGRVGDGVGGTYSFVRFWEARGIPIDIIRLDAILTEELHVAPAPVESFGPDDPTAFFLPSRPSPNFSSQQIKAMLFADIVGYSKLTEVQIPAFVTQFLGDVARLMDQMAQPPIIRNTWGDAIYCVFDHVVDAGLFALKLRDLVLSTDWTQVGLPQGMNIRTALHAGPAYPCEDPVLSRPTFVGTHVTRTARIEPIAEEGQIYASQAFAALSAADGVVEYVCDYVGIKQLAKKYGSSPVFLVRPSVSHQPSPEPK